MPSESVHEEEGIGEVRERARRDEKRGEERTRTMPSRAVAVMLPVTSLFTVLPYVKVTSSCPRSSWSTIKTCGFEGFFTAPSTSV